LKKFLEQNPVLGAMAQAWLKHGSSMAQAWLKHGSSMAQALKHTQTWLKTEVVGNASDLFGAHGRTHARAVVINCMVTKNN
jgi:hypothetical protein